MPSGRGRWLYHGLYTLAYAAPGAIAWALIGGVVWLLRFDVVPMVILGGIYAAYFGTMEALNLPHRRVESQWQVPSRWLEGRGSAIRTLIWGSLLGPGLATRNPYAGIWLLPILLALSPSLQLGIIGGAITGAAHGIARATGVLSNRGKLSSSTAHLFLAGERVRWEQASGRALLAIAGVLVATALPYVGLKVI